MRKNIAMICVTLAAVIAAQGCINHEIRLDSFEELCIASGGELVQDNPMQCRCEEVNCNVGVVCMTDSKNEKNKTCANDKIEGTLCNPDDMENTKKCESGKIFKCQQDADLSYRWLESKSDKCPLDYLDYCMNSSTCAECENNTLQCNGKDDSRIDICVNGKWELSSYCETGLCISDGDGKAKCADCRDADPSNEIKADTKCENDALYTCENGVWGNPKNCTYPNEENKHNVQKGEYVSCNLAGDNCGECKNGAVYCEGSGKYICQNGEWSAKIDCLNNTSCVSDTSCGECKDKDTKCQNNMHFICNNGNWIMDKVCEFGCVDENMCAVCNSGDIKCEDSSDGGKYSECLDGKWTENKSCNGASCTQAFCDNSKNENCKSESICGKCLNGDMQCTQNAESEDVIQICETGEWRPKDNTALCTTIHNENAHFDGETVCINGELKLNEPCLTKDNNPASCDSNLKCGECLNDDYRCEVKDGSSRIEVCKNGHWDLLSFCDTNSCSKNGKTCGCQFGEQKCETDSNGNSFILRCNEDGDWKETEKCSNQVSCTIEEQCGVCKDGDYKCENDVGTGKMYICVQGNWKLVYNCGEDIMCKDNISCSQCKNGEKKCVDGTIQECTMGSWKVLASCDSGICNSNNLGCAECISGNERCKDGIKQICTDNKWGTPQICDLGCRKNEKDCAECIENKETCDNGIKKICQDGVWNIADGSCGGGNHCIEDALICMCKDETCGIYQCQSQGPGPNVWAYKEACSGGNSCNLEGNCGSCIDDKKYCAPLDENPKINAVSMCANGVLGNRELCQGNVRYEIGGQEFLLSENHSLSCNVDNDSCAQCRNGDTYCVKANSSEAYFITCNTGILIHKKCDLPGCSSDNTKCQECYLGQKRYKENELDQICQISECKDGVWGDYKNNPNGYSCNSSLTDVGTCNNNDAPKYKNDTDEYCVETLCKNGEPVLTKSTSVSCNATNTGLGICLNGWFDYQKEGADITNINTTCVIQNTMKCVNGDWKTLDEAIGKTVMHCSASCTISEDNKYIKCSTTQSSLHNIHFGYPHQPPSIVMCGGLPHPRKKPQVLTCGFQCM